MDLLDILLFALGGLGILFVRAKMKLRSAEAVLTNLETNTKVQKLEGEAVKNNALIQAEEAKRKSLTEVNKTELKDFFNE